jgi:hypothetical protein
MPLSMAGWAGCGQHAWVGSAAATTLMYKCFHMHEYTEVSLQALGQWQV